ncbi:cytochrome P450 4F22 [Octopus sinensis]|uniref:Cytochrome P450 4F22 n=1 Tax=Octopus sinensis TaxID=2607531 RepID=A0A6P7TLE4_9MOLL|nr:cytochrome P450 4F22 [Octopus sinensis]XP_036369229.1 cytochrome P450 4F22 [Octopus sinensis]
MAIVVVLLITFLVLCLLYTIPIVWKEFKTLRARQNAASKFHCLPRHWLWGNMKQIKSPIDLINIPMKMVAAKHHSYSLWFTSFLPDITIVHPDALKPIICSAEPKPMKILGYNFVLPWLGDGLLLSSGKKWERNRKLLTPAFHFDILKPNISVFNLASDKLNKQLEVQAVSGDVVNLFKYMSNTALDILLRSALSYSEEEAGSEAHASYIDAVNELCYLLGKRAFNVLHYITWIYKLSSDGKKFLKLCDQVHEFSENIIKARRKTLEKNPDAIRNKRKVDFLDIMLLARDSNGVGLTDLDIRNEVDTFMFAGHDTTACSLSWMVYSLACFPDHQQKIYEEISQVMQDREYVTWDDIPNFRYLTACLKESIRLFSTVPIITRVLTKPMQIDGHMLPVGSSVTVNIYAIHHNPDVWEDPYEFLPERFLDSPSPQTSFNYIPFSAGPRNCIGQNFAMLEMKVIIAKIVRNFEIFCVPNFKAEPSPEVVLKSNTGIKVILKPRVKKFQDNF